MLSILNRKLYCSRQYLFPFQGASSELATVLLETLSIPVVRMGSPQPVSFSRVKSGVDATFFLTGWLALSLALKRKRIGLNMLGFQMDAFAFNKWSPYVFFLFCFKWRKASKYSSAVLLKKICVCVCTRLYMCVCIYKWNWLSSLHIILGILFYNTVESPRE